MKTLATLFFIGLVSILPALLGKKAPSERPAESSHTSWCRWTPISAVPSILHHGSTRNGFWGRCDVNGRLQFYGHRQTIGRRSDHMLQGPIALKPEAVIIQVIGKEALLSQRPQICTGVYVNLITHILPLITSFVHNTMSISKLTLVYRSLLHSQTAADVPYCT